MRAFAKSDVRAAVLMGLSLALSSPALRAEQPEKSPVQVCILAGQSNMEGFGTIEGADRKGTLRYHVGDPATADRFKHLVDDKGNWVVRNDVWVRCLPLDNPDRGGSLTVGFGANHNFVGPEFGFGLVIGEALDNQVLLIKIAYGGRSLAKDFRPPSSGGEVGDAYHGVVNHTRDVLKNLKTYFPDYDGRGYEIAGFGWHQGWNDGCSASDVAQYEQNLANFIRDVRKEFGVADLPFVIANSGFAGWEQKVDRRLGVMQAQAAVAELDEFRGNVVCVETRDFFRPYPSRHNYHWNFNGETQYLIGEAMGKAMLKLLGE